MVTIQGPAGVGKTRLAIAAAERAAASYADGVVFVGLADVRRPDLFASTLAAALGVADVGALTPTDMMIGHLRDREVLLVLDNLEQIVEVGPAIADLLAECPRVTVLSTSRRALDLRAEHTYLLEPLSLPLGEPRDAEASLGSDAVALVIARLSAINHRYIVSADDVVTIAQICRRLDGLPLALELAAARTRALSLSELLSALDRRLPVLTRGPRDMPERQRTMTDALAWSHELLSEEAAAVLSRLGTAVGGVDASAVLALCADLRLEEVVILDALDELVRHSVIRRDEAAGTTRFHLLEVVREFALGQLSPAEAFQVRKAHTGHYLAEAESAASGFDGPNQALLLDQVQRDGANYVGAIRSAVLDADAEVALRLCMALRFMWYVRGSLSEGRAMFADALALPGSSDELRAMALVEAAALARCQGAYAEASEMLAEARSLVDGRQPRALAATLLQTGFVAHLTGDYNTARGALEQALVIRDSQGDQLGMARAMHHLALVEVLERGDVARAWDLLCACLTTFRRVGNDRHVATVLIAMTDLARERGDLTSARSSMAEAVSYVTRLADVPLLVHALYYAAGVAADERHLNRALRLLGAAEGLAARSGAVPWPAVAGSADRWLPGAIGSMGRPRTERLRTTGAELDFDAAVALARTEDATGSGPLTQREYEIAGLVAQGLTNRLIAEQLVVSERTVDGHVGRILTKLSMHARSQIAVWMADSRAF
ncbi:MAG: putative transcriptional regulator [Marmoricola sp.]|nr:putative transcriptional regulator [Marmoricola sp.]